VGRGVGGEGGVMGNDEVELSGVSGSPPSPVGTSSRGAKVVSCIKVEGEILSSEPVGDKLLSRSLVPSRPVPPNPMTLGLSESSSVSVGVGEPGVASF
jgi:hypothetical protein